MLRLLRDGRDVALVTDAGMPGVQDPGMRLVARVVSEGLDMTVLPGPSAVLTALVAAGIDGDGFRFVGYLPRRARELESSLTAWRRAGGLLVAFETGQRLARSLAVLAAHLPDARAAVCRELTKLHEDVVRGTLLELSERYPVPGPDAGPRGRRPRRDHPGDRPRRGRWTTRAARRPDAETAAGALLARGLSRRDAAAALHVCLGLPRREAERAGARDRRRGRRLTPAALC